MKRKNTSFVLLSVLILTLFLGVFSVNGLRASTLNFTFEKDSILSDNSPEFYTQETLPEYVNFNVRNATELTQTYVATYSFENETGLSGTDISFVDSGQALTEVQIILELNGHSEVLNHTNTAGNTHIRNNFEIGNLLDGQIEFWIMSNDVTKYQEVRLLDNSVNNMQFKIEASKFQYVSGGAWHDVGLATVNNIWYHVSIEWVDDATDTWDISINGILYKDDVNLGTNMVNGIDFIQLWVNTHSGFYDGIGYSWDGYNATYSFNDDTDGNNPTNWIVDETGGTVEVINYLDGHYKIVEFDDTDGGNSVNMYNEFSNQITGVIEFWIYITDASKFVQFSLYDVDDRVLYSYFGDDKFYYVNGGTIDTGYVPLDDTWIHMKVDFNCTSDTFDYYVDNVLIVDNGDLTLEKDYINKFRLTSGTPDSSYQVNWDAFGYSWDSYYEIGDNLIHYSERDNMIPITTIENSRKEMDKFEFALEGVNDAFDINDDNPSGWTDVEQSGGDQVNIGSYPADIDKKVLVICDSSTDTRGLNRDFSVSGEFIEINFTHEYSVLTGTGGTNFYIDSSDDTLIVSLRMLITGEVEWDDGGWNEIFNGLTTGEEYVFNFVISYEMEVCIFSYYIDGVYQNTYIFPLMVLGKEGLGTVQMTNQLVTNDDVNFEIDNIGVYVGGISLADTEFSYLTYEIGKNWSYQEQNLFFINASGYFGIYAVDFDVGSYSIPHVAGMGQPLETINSGGTHYDVKVLVNLYDDEMTEYPTGMNNTFLVFYLSSGNISLNSIDIEGVKLTEGINDYYMDYSYSGLNSDESYFYVESNRLYFTMTLNDVGLEYMEARFNINNILSENRSVSFASDFNGDMHGYLRLNYTDDTSTFIPFPSRITSTSLILPQEKGIDSLIVLITDLDEAHFGVNTGYISEIQLLYFPDVSITIATTSLLDIIVPLMILLIPTFAIYKKFGESAIIPMFMLMSIICFISDLIPVWLFFILMFGSVVMLFTKKKIEAF